MVFFVGGQVFIGFWFVFWRVLWRWRESTTGLQGRFDDVTKSGGRDAETAWLISDDRSERSCCRHALLDPQGRLHLCICLCVCVCVYVFLVCSFRRVTHTVRSVDFLASNGLFFGNDAKCWVTLLGSSGRSMHLTWFPLSLVSQKLTQASSSWLSTTVPTNSKPL